MPKSISLIILSLWLLISLANADLIDDMLKSMVSSELVKGFFSTSYFTDHQNHHTTLSLLVPNEVLTGYNLYLTNPGIPSLTYATFHIPGLLKNNLDSQITELFHGQITTLQYPLSLPLLNFTDDLKYVYTMPDYRLFHYTTVTDVYGNLVSGIAVENGNEYNTTKATASPSVTTSISTTTTSARFNSHIASQLSSEIEELITVEMKDFFETLTFNNGYHNERITLLEPQPQITGFYFRVFLDDSQQTVHYPGLISTIDAENLKIFDGDTHTILWSLALNQPSNGAVTTLSFTNAFSLENLENWIYTSFTNNGYTGLVLPVQTKTSTTNNSTLTTSTVSPTSNSANTTFFTSSTANITITTIFSNTTTLPVPTDPISPSTHDNITTSSKFPTSSNSSDTIYPSNSTSISTFTTANDTTQSHSTVLPTSYNTSSYSSLTTSRSSGYSNFTQSASSNSEITSKTTNLPTSTYESNTLTQESPTFSPTNSDDISSETSDSTSNASSSGSVNQDSLLNDSNDNNTESSNSTDNDSDNNSDSSNNDNDNNENNSDDNSSDDNSSDNNDSDNNSSDSTNSDSSNGDSSNSDSSNNDSSNSDSSNSDSSNSDSSNSDSSNSDSSNGDSSNSDSSNNDSSNSDSTNNSDNNSSDSSNSDNNDSNNSDSTNNSDDNSSDNNSSDNNNSDNNSSDSINNINNPENASNSDTNNNSDDNNTDDNTSASVNNNDSSNVQPSTTLNKKVTFSADLFSSGTWSMTNGSIPFFFNGGSKHLDIHFVDCKLRYVTILVWSTALVGSIPFIFL